MDTDFHGAYILRRVEVNRPAPAIPRTLNRTNV